MIKEKTYRKYMKRIETLMDLDPKPHTKNGKELIRLARAAEIYEKVKWPLNHTKRRLRADLVSK